MGLLGNGNKIDVADARVEIETTRPSNEKTLEGEVTRFSMGGRFLHVRWRNHENVDGANEKNMYVPFEHIAVAEKSEWRQVTV